MLQEGEGPDLYSDTGTEPGTGYHYPEPEPGLGNPDSEPVTDS